MIICKTNNPETTFGLGRDLAGLLAAGDVICMSGDLGAGKTLLVQGIAAGLGLEDEVTSPTFPVLQVYESSPVPLYHFDLYRLDKASELVDVGFYEYVYRDGIAIIEWADKFAAEMPEERLWLELTVGESDQERRIAATPRGDRYEKLCEELKKIAGTCFRYSHPCV